MKLRLPVWYQHLNQRERTLAAGVGSIVFLLINFFVWSWLLGAIAHAKSGLATQRVARQEQTILLKERELWEQRDKWLQQHQPAFKGPADSSALLDQLKSVAAKYTVLVENPQIGAGETTANHQSVWASFETKSGWQPLVHFLYEVQQPEAFVVFESVNLTVDSTDAATMKGRFKVARWFAPPAGLKKG